MMLGLRAAATASAFLIALSGGSMALAQKQGGILRMSHFDSPASMSMHEEATGAVNRPMMGVFNNLVMYKQDETKNSVQSIAPDLASGWSWSEMEPQRIFWLRACWQWVTRHPRRSVLSQE